MAKDDAAPATKGDLRDLRSELFAAMDHMGSELRTDMHQQDEGLQVQINTLAQYVKAEAEETRAFYDKKTDEIYLYIDKKAEETMRHFDVVAEDMRHDILGLYNDKIVDLGRTVSHHGHRINRLEKRAGIISA